jgi:thioredoxin reductase (NADPH)
MEQIKQFEPGFTLGERAETIEKQEDGSFIVTSNEGTQFHSKVVAIAGGLGSFEPRKPLIRIFLRKGIKYFIKDPEEFRDKRYCRWRRFSFDWSIF